MLKKKPRNSSRLQQTAIHPQGIGRYLPVFLESSAISGCGVQTCYKRDTALRRFIAWCDERDLLAPQEITKPILERYQRHLFYHRKAHSGAPLTLGTQTAMLVPVKTIF